MREIKFQVLLDNKVVGYERLNESGWQWMWIELNTKNFERWVNGVITGSSSVLVRRMFTGLHDKNGKEVYEGDLLGKDLLLEVIFNDGGFCFKNHLPNGSDRLSQERVGRLEIIGMKILNY